MNRPIALATAIIVSAGGGALAQNSDRNVIGATMPSVVLVMGVDVIDSQLVPVASGSGTIVGNDGSVLTNHHVIYDDEGSRYYDLFVIGRFRAADKEPDMVCAGKPDSGRLKPRLDLALLKCDLDMNGRPWVPKDWPKLPVGRSEDIIPGDHVWVLGYPNIGGSTIHVAKDLVAGWTSEYGGTSSRAFMKTNASITHGSSGGTAINANGRLIGVPTAFRTMKLKGAQSGAVAKVGLIRPIEHARDLLKVVTEGWRTGKTQDAGPPAKAPDADPGVVVHSRIVDAASGKPIHQATVIILKPNVRAAQLRQKNLGKLALTWGQTNAAGRFTLAAPLAREAVYSVAVIAKGYRSLSLADALHVPKDAPELWDPWKEIRLHRQGHSGSRVFH